jgi:hypothetical protein
MVYVRAIHGGVRALDQRDSSLAAVTSTLQIPDGHLYRLGISISHLLGSLPLL